MLTKGAVEDLITLYLRPGPGAGGVVKKTPELKKKVFVSDWELRRLRQPGSRTISVPANAIISPLSVDWLDYEGITVLRSR